MLMANYLQGFLFKWRYAVLIILIISGIAAFSSFQINRWLPHYALSFADLITQQSHAKVAFKTVHYRFPNHLIFKNVNVLNGKVPVLQASRVIMGFSIPLFSSAFHVNNIVVNGLVINFPVLKDYLTQDGKKINTWIKTFPKGKMHVVVTNGQFILKNPSQGDPIAFKVDLDLDQDHLNAHGSWGDHDQFTYELYGNTRDSGFDLDKFTLENGRSSMNLWGSWRKENIDWKGFIFYDKLYILDIDGHLKMQGNDIVLKKLSFSVNKDNVTASGHCLKQDLFQCDAKIGLKDINLHLQAQNTPRGIFFKGMVDLQNMHLDFADLKARIVNGNILKIKDNSLFLIIKHGTLLPIKITAKNILASIYFGSPDEKAITLSAKMYEGNLLGRIFLKTSSWPWQVKGQGQCEGMDINILSHDLFSQQFHGLVSGNFDLQGPRNMGISGNLILHHGSFDDIQLQEWMTKTLQMPSLEHISGTELSGHFKLDENSKMLDDLRLDTDGVSLNGFFHLDADNLVSSQVSIRFSKILLGESPIGRHIMGLVHGAWTLPFDFSLSGNVYRMNFQWDKSPLKDRVRQHLFSFFERMIDRRMDAHPYYKVTIPNESVSPG